MARRSTCVVLLVLFLGSASVGVRGAGVEQETDVVRALEQAAAMAEPFADVPDDPRLYGFAARIERLRDRREVIEMSAKMLREMSSAGDLATEEEGRARRLDERIAAIEREAAHAGVTLGDTGRVIDAIIARRFAGEARKALDGLLDGSVSLDAAREAAVGIELVLGFGSHGDDLAREGALDEWDPDHALGFDDLD